MMVDVLSHQAFRFACDHCLPFGELEIFLWMVRETKRAVDQLYTNRGTESLLYACSMIEATQDVAMLIGFDALLWDENTNWPIAVIDDREVLLPPS